MTAETATVDRYARQTVLPEIGARGQAQLAGARVLVVGAGGLGAPALPYLAGAGVGHIRVVDPDTVARHNLHRQTLFTEADEGKPKALAAARRLRRLNSTIAIEAEVAAANTVTAAPWVDTADLVLDCADSVAVTYTLSDLCARASRPLVSGSVVGVSGYVGAFCGGAPSVRAVFPNVPTQLANCNDVGVFGPVVGVLGCLQAQMAIALIVDGLDSPLGSLCRFDGTTLRTSQMRFNHAQEPETAFAFIAADQVGANDRVIELRDEREAPRPVHPRADRLAPARVGELGPAAPGQRTVFCCQSGVRAWRAATDYHFRLGGECALLAAATEHT
ncbi:MAG: ThiF family adenylyltransferase [Pseudomonadota bacterium]